MFVFVGMLVVFVDKKLVCFILFVMKFVVLLVLNFKLLDMLEDIFFLVIIKMV